MVLWMKLIIAIMIVKFTFAELQVFPTKLSLSTRKKSTSITLRNRSTETTTYKISKVYYRQAENGSMRKVDEVIKSDRSLNEYLKFSPRRVTLRPGEEQVVRLMVRRSANLSEGDYRTHIRFEPTSQNEKEREDFVTQVRMSIKAKVAISVPVIFRQGHPDFKLSLEGLSISQNDNQSFYSVNMSKDGKVFAHGTLKLFYQKTKESKKKLISIVNGVSLYSDKRSLQMKIPDFKRENGYYSLFFYERKEDLKPLAKTSVEWNQI